jgi:hypothetical protein
MVKRESSARGEQHGMKGRYMKMAKKDDMRKEYRREDLDAGVRGKYYNEHKKGTNLVLLSPDVAAAFPDDDSVNAALRSLMKLAKHSISPPKHSTRTTKKQATG